MLKNIIFILLFAFLPASEIYKQVRIYSDTEETLSILQTSGLDIDHSFREPGKWIEFAISESRIHILDEAQLHYDIIHEDLERFYASRLDSEYESRDFDLGSMGGYYTFAEIEEHLDELYTDYPELITESGVAIKVLEGQSTTSFFTLIKSKAAIAPPAQLEKETEGNAFHAAQSDSNSSVYFPSDHCCVSKILSHILCNSSLSR